MKTPGGVDTVAPAFGFRRAVFVLQGVADAFKRWVGTVVDMYGSWQVTGGVLYVLGSFFCILTDPIQTSSGSWHLVLWWHFGDLLIHNQSRGRNSPPKAKKSMQHLLKSGLGSNWFQDRKVYPFDVPFDSI